MEAEYPSIREIKSVSLEEVLANTELACSFIMEGEYPLDLKLRSIALMAEDGKYCVVNLNGEELPHTLKTWFRKNSLVTDNFKSLQALLGENSPLPDNVFDIKTVHYLLHPDSSSHDLEAVLGTKPCNETDTLLSIWRAKEDRPHPVHLG